MPDLSRQQIREILEWIEGTTNIDKRQLRRVLVEKRGLLHGAPGTDEERKFGKVIEPREQTEFFGAVAEEMQLTKKQREKLMFYTHPRRIGGTLRRVEASQQSESDDESEDESDKKKDGGGGLLRFLGLR